MKLSLVTQDDPRRGILLMLVSVFFFSLMNALAKHLVAHFSVFQVGFFRCLFALPPVLMAIFLTTGMRGLRTDRFKGHALRATTGTISMMALFYSFHLLPLADAVALNFTGPLFLTVLAFLFMKETVSRAQWAGLFAGFIGILIVVRPWQSGGEVSGLGVVVGLVNALFYAFSMMGVRSLGRTEAPTTTVFYFMFLSMLLSFVPMTMSWQQPSSKEFLILAAGGMAGGIGQLFMTRAYQYAPAGVVSPFGYSAILWATSFGYLLWGEIPYWTVYLGSAIVIASEIGIYWSKRQDMPVPASEGVSDR